MSTDSTIRELKIQNWALSHEPDDKMLWKQSFWDNIIFMRDVMLPMMFSVRNKDKDTWESQLDRIDSGTSIIGTHYSKSIEMPVLLIKYRGIEIVLRYNFYNWEFTVISDVPIRLSWDLLDRYDEVLFFEGFPEKYQLDTRYKQSHMKFSGRTPGAGNYVIFTILHCIKEQVDNKRISDRRRKKLNKTTDNS